MPGSLHVRSPEGLNAQAGKVCPTFDRKAVIEFGSDRLMCLVCAAFLFSTRGESIPVEGDLGDEEGGKLKDEEGGREACGAHVP